MRKLGMIMAFALIWVAISVVPALGEVDLEPGATFDGGICWEADGTEGISAFDGQCVTPADYDAIFSYENLSQTESSRSGDEGKSIAEVYEMVPEDDPASDRPIGVGVSSDMRTFKERVVSAHAPHVPLAD